MTEHANSGTPHPTHQGPQIPGDRMTFEGLPLVDIGAPALVALVVLMILTDRLVWHKRLDILTKRIEAQDETIKALTEQNTMLLNSAIPTVNAVLGALHQAAGDAKR